MKHAYVAFIHRPLSDFHLNIPV